MKELVIGIIIVFLCWLFLYLPIMGFAYLYLGDFALGLLHLLPLLCLIGVLLYRHYVIAPEKTHLEEDERQKKLEARRTEEVRQRDTQGQAPVSRRHPNRSNVVGIVFYQMFPHLSSGNFGKSFNISRTPILSCDPDGIRTKNGVLKIS